MRMDQVQSRLRTPLPLSLCRFESLIDIANSPHRRTQDRYALMWGWGGGVGGDFHMSLWLEYTSNENDQIKLRGQKL